MKQELFDKFMKQHEQAYQDARRSHAVAPRAPGQSPRADDAQERAAAMRQQAQLQLARAEAETAAGSRGRQFGPHGRVTEPDADGSVRLLSPDDLPPSPIEMATELIARSGVWRSKEQYLATLFLLEPLQQVWERARREGAIDELQRPGGVIRFTRDMPMRPVFLHGPGGSGKTHCMTEVVIKVVRHFLGERGAKAIAAQNSAARLLLGKTMHAAGKLNRKQSLKAKQLKPSSQKRRALETEWVDPLLLLCDELSLAPPPLLAGVSRRAFHGRARPLRLNADDIMDHPFGDILLQALMGDFLQLNPVKSHTLVEAFATSRVPGVPEIGIAIVISRPFLCISQTDAGPSSTAKMIRLSELRPHPTNMSPIN